ncbi:hypothetical protein [Halosimplex halobium]|uniref:hypothetical protein n=1 Tax=Halosimplex halobium TaxID=3396618 RepID=UPI003F568FB2
MTPKQSVPEPASIRNVFTDEEMNRINEIAEEYGIETEWTNDGVKYMPLFAANSTEIYVPVNADRMHQIAVDIPQKYGEFVVDTHEYEEQEYKKSVPDIQHCSDKDKMMFDDFDSAVEEFKSRF